MKGEKDMKDRILQIVEQICNMEFTDCRGLSKVELARELMNLANIPQNADIQEIPLDWNNQVVILFLLPNDKNYYSLFAGIGCDGKFYFELSITGILKENGWFQFFEEEGKQDEILPIDYFEKRTTVTGTIKQFIKTVMKVAITECQEITIAECQAEYTSQIKEYDYYGLVNWANWRGIQVPDELTWIIDPDF